MVAKEPLSLSRFILRSQVIELYRDFLRSIQPIQDAKTREEMRQWIRHDFQSNKNHQDEELIRMHISRGRLALRELQVSVLMPTSAALDRLAKKKGIKK